jgi:site-specific recombinase XerD
MMLFSPGKERNTKRAFLENLDSMRLPAFVVIIPYGHTNATLLIASGAALPTVAKRLGHATTATTTSIYAHAIRSADEAAAETLENILNPLKSSKTSVSNTK